MHKSNKRASAVASDTDSLSSSAERRGRGGPADEPGLTDTPLPGGGELLDPSPPQLEHPSEPSEPASENVKDSAISEGIEGSEGSEGGLSGGLTHARASDSNGPEGPFKPFDPFTPFERQQRSRPVMHPRLKVSLAAGFDPHRLGLDLWRQLAKTNHEVPLLYSAAGRPVRLEYIDNAARVVDLNRDRLAHEVHRIARFFRPTAGRDDRSPRSSSAHCQHAGDAGAAHSLATPSRDRIRTVCGSRWRTDYRRWIPSDGGDVP